MLSGNWDNELSGSMKSEEFLDQLIDYQALNYSVPWIWLVG
jgi:hypothetical protein